MQGRKLKRGGGEGRGEKIRNREPVRKRQEGERKSSGNEEKGKKGMLETWREGNKNKRRTPRKA